MNSISIHNSTISPIKVSIITVVYNSGKTLEQTINSVINQSYKNIEYIIVDGGSTDNSLDIIKKYQTNIARWISEPDKGISDAFNKGIKLCTGEIIGIINADDFYEPNAVEIVVNNLNEKYDVYCGDLILLGKNDEFVKLKPSKISLLNFGMYIMHPTTFIRSKVYTQIGGYQTDLKIAMDLDLMLRIKNNNFKFKYIKKTLASMRTEGVSSDLNAMKKEALLVLKKHLSLLQYLRAYCFNNLNVFRMLLQKRF